MTTKGDHDMNRQLTAIVEREGEGYVALCPEVDVASQGDTVTEARDNLAEALTLFFGTASAGEIDRRMRSEVYVTNVLIAGLKTAVLSGRQVCRILASHGFVEVRRRGSHVVMQKAEADGTITVPVL